MEWEKTVTRGEREQSLPVDSQGITRLEMSHSWRWYLSPFATSATSFSSLKDIKSWDIAEIIGSLVIPGVKFPFESNKHRIIDLKRWSERVFYIKFQCKLWCHWDINRDIDSFIQHNAFYKNVNLSDRNLIQIRSWLIFMVRFRVSCGVWILLTPRSNSIRSQ